MRRLGKAASRMTECERIIRGMSTAELVLWWKLHGQLPKCVTYFQRVNVAREIERYGREATRKRDRKIAARAA
jgi:hypothetical protein